MCTSRHTAERLPFKRVVVDADLVEAAAGRVKLPLDPSHFRFPEQDRSRFALEFVGNAQAGRVGINVLTAGES